MTSKRKTAPKAEATPEEAAPVENQMSAEQVQQIVQQLAQENQALKADLNTATSMDGQLNLQNVKLTNNLSAFQNAFQSVCQAADIDGNTSMEAAVHQLRERLTVSDG